jgi:carbamate kinase
MGKRIVIALGGNALGKTISEQAEVVKGTAKAVAGLVRAGHQVVISHGNGPQVGMIQKAMTALHKQDPEHYELCPLSVCTAMSQGYIGLDLQRALRNELEKCGILKSITTILTQVEVNPNDDAFKNPSKPIGAYVTEAEAEVLRKERGFEFAEDAGRGIRRVVPSPKPQQILELESIRKMVEDGQIVIACGGGGVPVVKYLVEYFKGNVRAVAEDGYFGTEAIIDKDFASEKLAEELNADYLIILTAVEKVAIFYGTPRQKWLEHMSVREAEFYIEDGQFAPGSMLPKVEAAVAFAKSGHGRKALITLLEKAEEGIEGRTGTEISMV